MLEYLALGMLLLSVTAVFYIFIYIHDLPHRYAKKRHHPQEEAIHYACWLSLFTLHAIWPLVFLWAVSNKSTVTVQVAERVVKDVEGEELSQVRETLAKLDARLAELENKEAQDA